MKNTTFVIEIHSAVIHREFHVEVQTIEDAQTIAENKITACECTLGRWQETQHIDSGNEKGTAITASIYNPLPLGLLGHEIGEVYIYPPLPF